MGRGTILNAWLDLNSQRSIALTKSFTMEHCSGVVGRPLANVGVTDVLSTFFSDLALYGESKPNDKRLQNWTTL